MNRILLNCFFYICLFLFNSAASAADGTIIEAKQLFQKAQETFNTAQRLSGEERRLTLLKAASQFKMLVENQGIKNGYLFYNIGNAYFEAGEMGHAILYYRKAKRLIPGFPDLNYNLNIARQELNTPQPMKEWWQDIAQGLFFWHHMLDYSTRRWVAIAGFIAFWLLLTGLLFFRSVFLKAAVIFSAVSTLAFGGSFLFSATELNVDKAGVIIEQNSEIRKGPGLSYENLYEKPLPEGTEFDLLEVHGEWWKVRLVNGDEGWIDANRSQLI